MKYAILLACLAWFAGALPLSAADKKTEALFRGKTLKAWFRCLQEAKTEEERQNAAEAIAEFGPEAAPLIPELVKMLDDRDMEYRFLAAGILNRIGPAAKETMPKLLACYEKEKDDSVRWEIIDALTEIGLPTEQVVPMLIKAMKGHGTACCAMTNLGCIGPPAKDAVPALREALKWKSYYHRLAAAEALWKIARDPEAIDVLIHCLRYDGEPVVMCDSPRCYTDMTASRVIAEAVQALGGIGPPAKEALPQLKKLLAHESEWVRKASVQAIRQIDPEEGKKLKLNDDNTVTVKGVGKTTVPKRATGERAH